MHSYAKYLENLYRPKILNDERDGFICLDKNEAPFSAFEIVDDLIKNEDISSLNTYPDPYELYKKLADFTGVGIENLLLTFGSEQAIKFVFDIFLDEGDIAVYPSPSFAMFDVFAYYSKAIVRHLKYDNNLELSLEDILCSITEEISLFVLANPNNPTGTAYNIKQIEAITCKCKEANTIFLLDEAYFHYYDIDTVSLIRKYDNLIITRTFSKAWGLAGLRVGYAISSKKNIELLRKLKPIDEISTLSKNICIKALENADEILSKNVAQVKKWKNIFKIQKLDNLKYINTEGNFILLKSTDYQRHIKLLMNNNYLPKIEFRDKCLQDCLRFSIASDAKMSSLIKILKKDGVF